MQSFEFIYARACELQGSETNIQQRLPTPKTPAQLRKVSDAEYLSLMSRRIFRAGLKHSMVDGKWPAFEKAFHGFDIDWVRMMSDDDLDVLMTNKTIIRHWRKINAVRDNAGMMYELLRDYSGFGDYLATWDESKIIELWDELKRCFTQLGGNSGPYFLRMAGKDTFLLSYDVIRALNQWGAYQGTPKGKKAFIKVQDAFNYWKEESHKPLCHISRILAMSVD